MKLCKKETISSNLNYHYARLYMRKAFFLSTRVTQQQIQLNLISQFIHNDDDDDDDSGSRVMARK